MIEDVSEKEIRSALNDVRKVCKNAQRDLEKIRKDYPSDTLMKELVVSLEDSLLDTKKIVIAYELELKR